MSEAVGRGSKKRRERWAWYLYDFGNSAYAAVVLLAVYAAYFKGEVVGGAEGSRLWGISVGIAMLFVAVISPILGTIADYSGSKGRFLLIFTLLACTCTGLLFFVEAGDVLLGMGLFILAEIGYRSAQVFYNSLLPDIAEPDELASVSGTGWAIGSAGGIVCLLIILPLIAMNEGTFFVRLSLVITAVFFGLSSIPIFLRLRDRGGEKSLPEGTSYPKLAFSRLLRTARRANSFREFLKFMVAFLIYNDGVIMALDFAAIIGAVLFGMDQQRLIMFVILVNLTNVIGAWAFGLMAKRSSCKRALVASLLLMLACIGWMFFATSEAQFFVIGGLAGFAMAGIQSVSRTMVTVVSPEGQSAEFFGFFAVAGRTSSFIGPTVYGIVAKGANDWFLRQGQTATLAEQMGQRVAILSIGVFLSVGLVLLLLVSEQRGREAARAVARLDAGRAAQLSQASSDQ